ncbi:MAG: hypothetical protein ACE5IH_06100 [Thermodesulfobacteriota bacterium]
MVEELRGRLYSTVVGSFPFKVDKALMGENDWSRVTEIRETSFRALGLQLGAGIEFPSDGQFFDMVDMYLQPLMEAGFLKKDRSFGEGELPKAHPATTLESLLEALAKKSEGLGLRVPITGPFTLGYRVKTGGKSLMEAGDSAGVLRLADAVKTYSMGFDRVLRGSILSIDEPVLPFVLPVFGENFVREVLNAIFERIKRNYSCMHVCGAVKSLKGLALSLDVEILDHEFQGTDNRDLYTKKELIEHEKLLSYGLINTNPKQVFPKEGAVLVESVAHIKDSLRAACKTYGVENLLVSPDCGFGGWRHLRIPEDEKWGYIKEKLSNMVRAREEYLAEVH